MGPPMTARSPYRAWVPTLLLALAMLLQSLAPSVAAAQRGSNFDISSYLCNQTVPSSQEASREAKIALGEILRITGKIPSGENKSTNDAHCQFCMLTYIALTAPAMGLSAQQIYSGTAQLVKPTKRHLYRTSKGPPLGERAPPILF